MRIHGPPKEIVDTWPEARKELIKKNVNLFPVNLRVMNDVEWDELKIERSKEGAVGYVVE